MTDWVALSPLLQLRESHLEAYSASSIITSYCTVVILRFIPPFTVAPVSGSPKVRAKVSYDCGQNEGKT